MVDTRYWHKASLLYERESGMNQAYSMELTKRESQVLQLLVDTYGDYNAIADKLGVSPTTVKTHINGLFYKLQASSKLEAVLRGYNLGLVRLPAPASFLNIRTVISRFRYKLIHNLSPVFDKAATISLLDRIEEWEILKGL